MLTLWDWPALLTTSIPLPVIVNVCGTDPAFVTLIVSPFFTVSVEGANTNPPAPCCTVGPSADGPPIDVGGTEVVTELELLLHAEASTAIATTKPISVFVPCHRSRILDAPFGL